METPDNIKQTEVSNPPDNYLVWAILTTILCCLPLGIVSIIKSTEVNTKWARGDYAGAQESAAAAKKWAIWSAASGFIVLALYLILVFVIGIGGALGGLMNQ